MTSDTPVRLAVFDCDGTLVDGQAPVCNAMEQAFAQAGLPTPDRHAVRQIVGLSLPQAIHRLAPHAPPERREQAVEGYKHAFRSARERGEVAEPLFDGIAELLAHLHRTGWTLAVATGKSQRGLDHCLAAHGLTGLFASLQAADGHPSKPDPAMLEAAMAEALAEPANTVMIGDTLYDMEMARAAGVRGIGVGWGYHDTDTLRAAGADAIAASVDALRDLL